MRWGPGPVFLYECLTNARRRQSYALRSMGVAALLIAMAVIAMANDAMFEGKPSREYARLGEYYFYAMIGVELALVMLAAPAATAGAICLDRARGTLAHMLMTDLSDSEIVMGKLAARLMPVLGLVACSWPVMAISSLLGGIDPIALALAFGIIVAMAILGCAIALALSVWAGKTHEVILSTYTVWILAALLWPIWYGSSTAGWVGPPPPWTLLANPFYVALAPYAMPGKLASWDYVGFFGVTLGSSTILTLLAVWRTRPVACRSPRDGSGRARLGLIGRLTRVLPGPSLDRDPVLWREWRRSRPTPWMTVVLALLMGTTAILCVVGAIAFWRNGVDVGPGPASIWEAAGVFSYFLHIAFGLLMLSAVAPSSMAEERQRGSLDILSATALSSRAIVFGKWLGTFRLAILMTVGPGLMAMAMATAHSGPFSPYPRMPPEFNREVLLGARLYGVAVVIATILAHGALVTSIGMASAVWIKRQGRAIAVSVGLFVLVNAVWPIIAVMVCPRQGFFGRDLGCLSPAVVCGDLVTLFANRRYGFVGEIVWAGTFWAVEVFILAMGLLWLTVRTFDDCFDRLPDRPRRLPILAIVAIVTGAMIGGASLVWTVDIWVEGFRRGLSYPSDGLVLAYSLAVTLALVLIAAVASTVSPTRGRGDLAGYGLRIEPTSNGPVPDVPARSRVTTIRPWRFVRDRWWSSFRLVLLVAIGPALLAMSLATAPAAPRYVGQTTKDAAGNEVVSWVLADPNVPGIAELPFGTRLSPAAFLILTILIHGAAGVSTGLAIAFTIRWTRRTVAVVTAMTVSIVFVVPLVFYMRSHGRPPVITMWSVVLAVNSHLDPLVEGWSFTPWDSFWIVFFWDLVIGSLSSVALRLAIRKWQRRELDQIEGRPSFEHGGEPGSLDVASALIAE